MNSWPSEIRDDKLQTRKTYHGATIKNLNLSLVDIKQVKCFAQIFFSLRKKQLVVEAMGLNLKQ